MRQIYFCTVSVPLGCVLMPSVDLVDGSGDPLEALEPQVERSSVRSVVMLRAEDLPEDDWERPQVGKCSIDEQQLYI